MLRAVVSFLLILSAGAEWKMAVPDYAWSFPRDHWAHDGYRTEWWYFTGNVETSGGRRFAYQFTLFRVGVVPERPLLRSAWASSTLVMGHAAVTDIASGRHLFSETLYREMPLLAGFDDFPEKRVGWSRAPAGTDDVWFLEWNGEAFDFHARDDAVGFGFTLSTKPDKPLIFQGPGGFSRKSTSGQASQYYSFTRLAASGELRLGDDSFTVSGTSWMDKEFSSSQLAETQVGWDWFSLQLEDGRDLMLYLMRGSAGDVDYASATVVGPAGKAGYLEPNMFEVEVVDRWTSAETGARYPSRWRISVLDETFHVEAVVPDQENRSRFPGGVYYWEGAVSVRSVGGAIVGEGFVELTGYGEGNRPPV